MQQREMLITMTRDENSDQWSVAVNYEGLMALGTLLCLAKIIGQPKAAVELGQHGVRPDLVVNMGRFTMEVGNWVMGEISERMPKCECGECEKEDENNG